MEGEHRACADRQDFQASSDTATMEGSILAAFQREEIRKIAGMHKDSISERAWETFTNGGEMNRSILIPRRRNQPGMLIRLYRWCCKTKRKIGLFYFYLGLNHSPREAWEKVSRTL